MPDFCTLIYVCIAVYTLVIPTSLLIGRKFEARKPNMVIISAHLMGLGDKESKGKHFFYRSINISICIEYLKHLKYLLFILTI